MSEVSSGASAPAAAAPAASPAPTGESSINKATNEILKTLPQNEAKLQDEVESAEEDASDEEVSEESVEERAEAKKKAVETAKKAYKLKVGGKDVEVDESELLKRAQMGYSADEKWQEAAKMRKQVEEFIGFMQKDPAAALEQLGFNVDELAENRIKAKIEEMKKSPEQLEKERIEKELKALKEERERERSEIEAREKQRLQDQYAMEIETDINAALDSNELGLPKSPYVIKRIADTMILAMQEGQRTNNQKLLNIKASDVLGIVQAEILGELNQMYNIAPDEVFEKLVGKDRLNKYRKSKVKKTAAPKPASASDIKPTGQKEIQARNEEAVKQKVSAKDFFKKLGSR